MTSPNAKDRPPFTAVLHDYSERLVQMRLSGCMWDVVIIILRETFGRGRDEGQGIARSIFAQRTSRDSLSWVDEALRRLQELKIIIEVAPETNREAKTWAINPRLHQWRPNRQRGRRVSVSRDPEMCECLVPDSPGSRQSGTLDPRKCGTTQEIETKKTDCERRCDPPPTLTDLEPLDANHSPGKGEAHPSRSVVRSRHATSTDTARELAPRQAEKLVKEPPAARILLAHHEENHKKKLGCAYLPSWGKDLKLASEMLRCHSLERLKRLNDAFFASDDKFIQEAGFAFGVFHSQINRLVHKTHSQEAKPRPSGWPLGWRRCEVDRGYERYYEEWNGEKWVPFRQEQMRDGAGKVVFVGAVELIERAE